MRAYEQSHPFISFQIDLRRADVPTWILLGEAQSKCDHISGVPLRPAVAKELHRLYLIKGVQATVAIEGNTLTEREVEGVLDGTLQVPQSKEYLAQEVRNIAEACDSVVRQLKEAGQIPLTVDRIREFNVAVLKGLELPEHLQPGRTRACSVGVGTYRAAPWEDCDYLLDRLVEWLNSETFRSPVPELEIAYAIIKAVVTHLYIAWIHPFGDGNGRTARLIEVQILMSAGVSTPGAHLLSNHYNQTRAEYYRHLERASASGGDLLPFLQYAVRGFVDGLRAQLSVIRKQQLDVAWEAYVHEVFDGAKSAAEIRRRHLVLDLGKATEPIPFNKLSTLSPRIAADYASLTPRTVFRDGLKLTKQNLARFGRGGLVANKELIQAFLPVRRVFGPKEA